MNDDVGKVPWGDSENVDDGWVMELWVQLVKMKLEDEEPPQVDGWPGGRNETGSCGGT